jgi:oxygen-independent coproporphyrinogen-3 oxidase
MEKRLGLYIHIPFCLQKCAYCDFYSITDTKRRTAYVRALIEQIRSFGISSREYIVDSIYIGGGTPSLLWGEELESILCAVRSKFRLSDDVEISMEANPGTLDGEKLASYRAAGVNRLSIGLQSADDGELKKLSRIHTKEEFESAFLLARLEGFQNISVDIMYALPDQTPQKLADTLSYVIELDPEHISFYGLKIEPETPFGKDTSIQDLIPDEDAQYEMYLSSAKTLENAGYMQYEISNFAKEGRECRHNIKYWHCEEYLGFGPAAYSFFDGKMFSYVRDVERYIADSTESELLLDEMNVPSKQDIATQYVMVCFRLRKGINILEYEKRFADDFEKRYANKLAPFIDAGCVVPTAEGYRLSRRGMLISNYILSEILDFEE